MKRVAQHNERHPVAHNWINFSCERRALDARLPGKQSPYSPGVILVLLSAPHRPNSPVIIFSFWSNKPSATKHILAWVWGWLFFCFIYIKEGDLIHCYKPPGFPLSCSGQDGIKRAGVGTPVVPAPSGWVPFWWSCAGRHLVSRNHELCGANMAWCHGDGQGVKAWAGISAKSVKSQKTEKYNRGRRVTVKSSRKNF